MKPDVSYCWSRVCVLTQQGGTNQHLPRCCHRYSLHISHHLAIGRRRSVNGVRTPFIGLQKSKYASVQVFKQIQEPLASLRFKHIHICSSPSLPDISKLNASASGERRPL